MKYDREKITHFVSELKTALSALQELSDMGAQDFFRDRHKISSAKYNLIVAIECAIDMCNHLISKNNFRVPEDYGDTFKVMAENGLISGEFADRLMTMAKFRNRLVHLYWKVDSSVIFEIMREDLTDLEDFLKSLKEWLADS